MGTQHHEPVKGGRISGVTQLDVNPNAPLDTAARSELVYALRKAVDGEVSDARIRRAEYSTDASNYRVVPQVVVIPKSAILAFL
jgi:hypothetical protein